MNKDDLPKKLAVFPLSNFIIFPKTSVPLNIFEPRYVDMINDSMKSNKLVGMIQPKILKNKNSCDAPQLHEIGCMGKITSFKETEDARYLIELKGVIRFKIIKEVKTNKKYRECEINFDDYLHDLNGKKEDLKFSDLELIFKDLKILFEKRGFIINWKALEKQILLEAKNLDIRKNKIAEILSIYSHDQYNNTTVQ